MRRRKTEKVAELLTTVLKDNELYVGFNERKVINSWGDILGEQINRYTTNIEFKNRSLLVYISSSVVRHELFLKRYQIVEKINRHIGEEVVKEIIFK